METVRGPAMPQLTLTEAATKATGAPPTCSRNQSCEAALYLQAREAIRMPVVPAVAGMFR